MNPITVLVAGWIAALAALMGLYAVAYTARGGGY